MSDTSRTNSRAACTPRAGNSLQAAHSHLQPLHQTRQLCHAYQRERKKGLVQTGSSTFSVVSI